MKNLTDKVAIITGGSRGIGQAIALSFAKEGAKVVINFKENKQAAQATLEMITALDAKAIVVQADIATKEGREQLVLSALKTFGKIDVLVNNAGILHFTPFFDYAEDSFDALMDANIKAPFFLSQLVAKEMVKQKISGNIINIASMCGFRTCDYDIEAYNISKAGLIMLSQSLAHTLAKNKIRVNTISPGIIKTDINRENWEGNTETWQNTMSKIPHQDAGNADDIAGAAVYLASDAAAYTTAANIVIDGGLSNYFPIE